MNRHRLYLLRMPGNFSPMSEAHDATFRALSLSVRSEFSTHIDAGNSTSFKCEPSFVWRTATRHSSLSLSLNVEATLGLG